MIQLWAHKYVNWIYLDIGLFYLIIDIESIDVLHQLVSEIGSKALANVASLDISVLG